MLTFQLQQLPEKSCVIEIIRILSGGVKNNLTHKQRSNPK